MAVIVSIIICSLPLVVLGKESTDIIKYQIRPADTYHLLSIRFNTTVDSIADANKKVNPDNLLIGQKIYMPIGKDIFVHKVYKGDVLWKIAEEYGSTIETIAVQNYIKDPNLIYTGDILAIPKDKKIVRLTGSIGEFGMARSLSKEDYDGAYALYTTMSEQELDTMVNELNGKIAQPRVDEKGQLIRDAEGNIVYYGTSRLWVDEKGQWNVWAGVSGFTSRMGIGWGIARTFRVTLKTDKEGFTNGVPVDVAKFAKAVFVYEFKMLEGYL